MSTNDNQTKFYSTITYNTPPFQIPAVTPDDVVCRLGETQRIK